MTEYQSPMFERLEPHTPFKGGRITDTDVLTLTEAARFASVHAGTEITPADFLRAGGRGEIPMRAINPRTVTMQPCREADASLPMPANSIPTLPLDACKALANTGRAAWRTIDWFEPAASFAGALCRFTRWQLPDSEPDILTTPDDCRVTGHDVHCLADAFTEAPATDTAKPAPETVEQRCARFLAWFTEEQRINPRGALQRVTEREAKQNPKADRSNISKDIKKARGTAKTQKQAGAMFGQLVQVKDGKRQH